jgi:hypothetical protein
MAEVEASLRIPGCLQPLNRPAVAKKAAKKTVNCLVIKTIKSSPCANKAMPMRHFHHSFQSKPDRQRQMCSAIVGGGWYEISFSAGNAPSSFFSTR